jgi:hypothetical protein
VRTTMPWALIAALLLAPFAGEAANTGTVYVLLKNDGVGTFSSSHDVRVFANGVQTAAYNKSAYGPTTNVALSRWRSPRCSSGRATRAATRSR